MSLFKALQSLPQNRGWVVAYSGGLDSSVLLHACGRYFEACKLKSQLSAIHIHHGLSQHADHWLKHCEAVCSAADIPLVSSKVTVTNPGSGIEAAARKARYQAFINTLSPQQILLQGHHLNDQAETVLYRLIQGHGTQGMAGIPPHRALGESDIYRPLLGLRRADLEVLAQAWGVQWVDDDSNKDTGIARNYLRVNVVPAILKRWPAALDRIAVAAKWNADASALAREVALEDLERCQSTAEKGVVDLCCLTKLSDLRQSNLLRYWLHRLGVNVGEEKLLGLFSYLASQNGKGARFSISANCQIAKYRNQLSAIFIDNDDVSWSAEWCIDQVLDTPMGRLQAVAGSGGTLRRPEAGEVVTVRFRQGGERFQPVGRGGSCSLKKWLQESGIPEWERSRIPLIFYGEHLVAVADYAIDIRFRVVRDGVELRWFSK